MGLSNFAALGLMAGGLLTLYVLCGLFIAWFESSQYGDRSINWRRLYNWGLIALKIVSRDTGK